MDSRGFDRWTRALAARGRSRRGALGLLAGGLAVAVGAMSGGARSASAHHCNFIGCGCATGTLHPCGGGLICCPSSPGLPGGAGVCAPPDQCGGACIAWRNACPGYCNWGDNCPDCCSGYCNSRGVCSLT